jgi:hypothetical protein
MKNFGSPEHILNSIPRYFLVFIQKACNVPFDSYSENCGGPAISLHNTVSLVQWVNRLLPAQGVSGSRPGDEQAHTMEPGFSC